MTTSARRPSEAMVRALTMLEDDNLATVQFEVAHAEVCSAVRSGANPARTMLVLASAKLLAGVKHLDFEELDIAEDATSGSTVVDSLLQIYEKLNIMLQYLRRSVVCWQGGDDHMQDSPDELLLTEGEHDASAVGR